MVELKNMRNETEREREKDKVLKMDIVKQERTEMLLERRRRMEENIRSKQAVKSESV